MNEVDHRVTPAVRLSRNSGSMLISNIADEERIAKISNRRRRLYKLWSSATPTYIWTYMASKTEPSTCSWVTRNICLTRYSCSPTTNSGRHFDNGPPFDNLVLRPQSWVKLLNAFFRRLQVSHVDLCGETRLIFGDV